MKILILMRHAEAAAESSGHRDVDRPLTANGLQMATKTAEILRAGSVIPDRILVSSALRTMQTAQRIAETLCPDAGLLALDELYLSPARIYPEAVGQHAEENDAVVLVIGHNPGIGNLMCVWSNQPISVSPATTAVFAADVQDWSELALEHRSVMRLDQLICDGAVVGL